MQNWAPKQANYLTRLSNTTIQLLADADALTSLCAEFTNDGYGTGGANALTDAVVQGQLPAATAVLVSEAEGALAGTNAVLATIAANRGYLEILRP
jgi:hypothetical protein